MDKYTAVWDLIWNVHSLVLLIALYCLGFSLKKVKRIPTELISILVGAAGMAAGWFYIPLMRPDVHPILGVMIGFISASVAVHGYEILKGMRDFITQVLENKAIRDSSKSTKTTPLPPSSPVVLLAALIPMFLMGCATTPAGKPPTAQDRIEAANRLIIENQEIIDTVLDGVRHLVISKAVSPDQRDEWNARLSAIGFTIEALVAEGKIDPKNFREVFRIKEQEIEQYLAFVPAALEIIWAKSGKNGEVMKTTLLTLAEGLK